jgi:hypothetical protein
LGDFILYAINTGKYVTKLPHRKEFDCWMKKLDILQYDKICNELNKKINLSDVNTSSWIPGNNWTGTVYQPIYKACGCNTNVSAQFFGLILFDLLMKRQDAVWGFGKYEKNGIPIKGTTYFLIKNPPPFK